jgi:UDP-N-acetylmuramate--alanine ligase
VINGGALVNWRSDKVIGNVRMGQGHYWVLEVDESDRSLLHFHPEWAALTNISRDHFSLEETIKLFQQFAAQVGVGICCGADVSSLLRSAKTVVEAVDPAIVRPSLRLIGEHNAHNAALAVTLCEALGVERQVALDALSDFRGIERRLEQVGAAHGVQVFDDYGHNTAKIAAACRAVSASIAGSLLAVWRPHGYGPLAAMADDLAEMFKQVLRPNDRLYVLPVYYAGGTANRQLESSGWVCRLQAAGIAAEHMLDYPALEKAILDRVREGDAVLCMGARDPELPFFARHLVQRLATV